MSIDYRALIRDRQAKQSRPIVRHEVCLVPELHSELEEAEEALRHWLVATAKPEGEEDKRGGGIGSAPAPEVTEAQDAVKDVQRRMADASLTFVFKAPTADQQAAENDELERAKKEEPDRINGIIVERSRASIIRCFDHAEGPGRERVEDLTREDVAAVVGEWSQGEVIIVANKILNASIGAPDLPFSAQQSLRTRRSNAT